MNNSEEYRAKHNKLQWTVDETEYEWRMHIDGDRFNPVHTKLMKEIITKCNEIRPHKMYKKKADTNE